MPKALEVDWDLLEIKYQKDGLSCRELAEMFHISESAVEQRCYRHKWHKNKTEVVRNVSELTTIKLVDTKVKAILEHESKALRVSEKLISGVENSFDSMHGEAIDSSHLNGLAQCLKTSVGVSRLTLGMVDPAQRVDVTTNGESLHARSIELLNTCKKLVAEGKVDPSAIDVESIVQSLQSDESAKS